MYNALNKRKKKKQEKNPEKLVKQKEKKEKRKRKNHLSPKIASGNIWFGLPVFFSMSIPRLFLGSLPFSICILVLGDILQACL